MPHIGPSPGSACILRDEGRSTGVSKVGAEGLCFKAESANPHGGSDIFAPARNDVVLSSYLGRLRFPRSLPMRPSTSTTSLSAFGSVVLIIPASHIPSAAGRRHRSCFSILRCQQRRTEELLERIDDRCRNSSTNSGSTSGRGSRQEERFPSVEAKHQGGRVRVWGGILGSAAALGGRDIVGASAQPIGSGRRCATELGYCAFGMCQPKALDQSIPAHYFFQRMR